MQIRPDIGHTKAIFNGALIGNLMVVGLVFPSWAAPKPTDVNIVTERIQAASKSQSKAAEVIRDAILAHTQRAPLIAHAAAQVDPSLAVVITAAATHTAPEYADDIAQAVAEIAPAQTLSVTTASTIAAALARQPHLSHTIIDAGIAAQPDMVATIVTTSITACTILGPCTDTSVQQIVRAAVTMTPSAVEQIVEAAVKLAPNKSGLVIAAASEATHAGTTKGNRVAEHPAQPNPWRVLAPGLNINTFSARASGRANSLNPVVPSGATSTPDSGATLAGSTTAISPAGPRQVAPPPQGVDLLPPPRPASPIY